MSRVMLKFYEYGNSIKDKEVANEGNVLNLFSCSYACEILFVDSL